MNAYPKTTTSLCPTCRLEIPAEIHQKNQQIWIHKNCDQHGMSQALIEPDARIYHQCAHSSSGKRQVYGLVLPISNRCNLDCNWCYLPDQPLEIPTADIKNIIDCNPHAYIVFAGGEPTLREDLGELIRHIRENHPQKYSILLTNGIKLADKHYVDKLKKNGLNYVILSYNGFRAETHEYLNNQNVNSLKLQALKNLESAGIWTILSVTLVKGLNEDEFQQIYQYALDHVDFIRQIRLRNVSEIGAYQQSDPIYLSDMIKLVSQATGFSVDEMLADHQRYNRSVKTANYTVFDIFRMLRRRFANSPKGEQQYQLALQKLVGEEHVRRLNKSLDQPKQTRSMLRIEIFAWPTAATIDLEQVRHFCVDHLTEQKTILPFWEALFYNDRLHRQQGNAGPGKKRVQANT